MYRPLLNSRNFISNYVSNVGTLTITPKGDVNVIGVDDANFAGSFCYLTL